MTKTSFQNTYTLDARRKFVSDRQELHPDKIVIYVYANQAYASSIQLECNKFLVNRTHTVGQFQALLYKSLQSHNKHQTIILFTDKGELPASAQTIEHLHAQHADTDGIIYLQIALENTFGFNPGSS